MNSFPASFPLCSCCVPILGRCLACDLGELGASIQAGSPSGFELLHDQRKLHLPPSSLVRGSRVKNERGAVAIRMSSEPTPEVRRCRRKLVYGLMIGEG